MKSSISGLKALLGLAALVVFLFAALQLRPTIYSNTGNSAQVASNPAGQAYPSPQQDLSPAQTEANSNPYPAPGGTTNMVQTSDCSKVGTWVEYVNKAAGFSFQYPAEAKIIESTDNNGHTSIDLFLRPECYTNDWWGTNKVSIAVLDNAAKLTLENFVAKQYNVSESSENPNSPQELAKSSETVLVDQVKALRINGKITRETPHVYIPNKDHVLFVGLVESDLMPPFEPVCSATLDLYNKILISLKFLK